MEEYRRAIIGSASMNNPIPQGIPIISDNLTPALAVSFNLFICFRVYASVIAGTKLMATAVENTWGKLIKVWAVPLSSPNISAISTLVYPIAASRLETIF